MIEKIMWMYPTKRWLMVGQEWEGMMACKWFMVWSGFLVWTQLSLLATLCTWVSTAIPTFSLYTVYINKIPIFFPTPFNFSISPKHLYISPPFYSIIFLAASFMYFPFYPLKFTSFINSYNFSYSIS
jgi:hypothetical protein